MSKWRAHFEKQKLNNELNKMHVYDPSMVKRDLDMVVIFLRLGRRGSLAKNG